jgi:hypothetical protein
VGQAEAAGFLNVIEDDIAAERPARDVGIIEGIDQRQAVDRFLIVRTRSLPRAGVLSVPAGKRGHSRKEFRALCAKSRVGHSVLNGDF